VNTLRGSRQQADSRPARSARPPAYLIASIALHLLVGVLLVRFLISPNSFMLIFGGGKALPVPVERIGFLALPKAKGAPVVGMCGGANRRATMTQRSQLIAPTTIPSTLPPVAPTR
jgi:hypothetical protein